ncbi:hypothetical protein A2U01_0035074 [Trifolium medium]|uniref:Uncharacterized protein n=1 Tax=Trifolium medium TaxID=97028 RepID=A0A392PR75_9FABA|nr:hypothetical protein [Trifolium medium]
MLNVIKNVYPLQQKKRRTRRGIHHMGKASRWFRVHRGLKNSSDHKAPKEKREKGAPSIKRAGEVPGIGERSHSAETNGRVARKNAITFTGTGTI